MNALDDYEAMLVWKSRALQAEATLKSLLGTGEDKWFSVAEKLPEPGIPVLVCEHRDDCPISLAEYLPDEVDKEDDAWEYGYGEWGTPSFWMPLPGQPIARQQALCDSLLKHNEA